MLNFNLFSFFLLVRFHVGNMRNLMEEMSEEERISFEIDASKINWRDYLTEIHIPGVKEHVLKGGRLPS